MSDKPNFRVGQVVYDKINRDYFKIDAAFLRGWEKTPEDKTFRPLTKREKGQK